MDTLENSNGHPQYLTFEMLGEAYAIGIDRVREIIEFSRVTQVPRMPDFVRGVINLRGTVVPVLDLATKFGLEPAPITRDTCIVILEVRSESGEQTVGIVTDAVDEVLGIPLDEVAPPPSFGTRIDTRFIIGMGSREDGFLLIVDIERVLSAADLGSFEEALEAENLATADGGVEAVEVESATENP